MLEERTMKDKLWKMLECGDLGGLEGWKLEIEWGTWTNELEHKDKKNMQMISCTLGAKVGQQAHDKWASWDSCELGDKSCKWGCICRRWDASQESIGITKRCALNCRRWKLVWHTKCWRNSVWPTELDQHFVFYSGIIKFGDFF